MIKGVLIGLLLAGWTTLCAATVEGTVRAEGKSEGGKAAGGGAYESRKFKFVEQVDYSKLKDFVVYLESAESSQAAPPAKPVKVITQKDATFQPHVMPIFRGTTVEWPNEDEILHNVFSDSEAAKFDLGLYKDEIKKVTFDKSGRVDVFCSIHTKMHCIVLVLNSPYFATADARGRFRIENVPPGKYLLKAWHERMPAISQEVEIPQEGAGPLKFDLVMGIKGLPKY